MRSSDYNCARTVLHRPGCYAKNEKSCLVIELSIASMSREGATRPQMRGDNIYMYRFARAPEINFMLILTNLCVTGLKLGRSTRYRVSPSNPRYLDFNPRHL